MITAPYTKTSVVLGPVIFADVRLIAGALALFLILAFWLFLRFTLTGRAIRAMGQNRRAAPSRRGPRDDGA